MKLLMEEAIKKFAGDAPAAQKQLPNFDVKDIGEFKINKESGWVEHAVITRTMKAAFGSHVEKFEFRVVPQDQVSGGKKQPARASER